MMNKEYIFSEAKKHLAHVGLRIAQHLKKTKESLGQSQERFKRLSGADQIVESNLIAYERKRVDELKHLQSSPYFVRCDVQFEGDGQVVSLYFSKFGFDQESIYSWLAPASVIRFESPGDVTYKLPDGKIQRAQLLRKDQFLIADKKIKFLSSEAVKVPRKLIYEEYFSTQKTGFILPEIVAQMEKAQDQVIRASHIGPFLISGPAGSGKTTLALHRVAYLAQSPEFAQIYTSKKIIVFVQDTGTKDYFSHLLPELGIDGVLITTFSEWAFKILDIQETFAERYGDSEYEKDLYEFQKLKALKLFEAADALVHAPKSKNFSLLERVYQPVFNERQQQLFARQKKERVYDRIDLTLLLNIFLQTHKSLSMVKEQYVELANGNLKKKTGPVKLEYSLAVIDEFQNYMPDQLKLINASVHSKLQSTVYVGDMAQQIKLGTIRKWEDIGIVMDQERQVVLKKVYRNTKNILQFIRKLGYQIEIPSQLKQGEEVREYIFASKGQEIEKIKEIIGVSLSAGNFGSMGILTKEEEYLVEFKETFKHNKKIHIMTMNEAQGVEFDIVVLVGIGRDTFVSYDENTHREIAEEKKRINKDLLYVALTRAISELHVMGREKLERILL